MKSVLPSPQRLLMWPLLLLLSIFVIDITVETLDFNSLTTTFEQEDETELARRTSKVSKLSVNSSPKDYPIVVLALCPFEESSAPVTNLFHSITNFVRSGAKIAKELTTIS